METRMTTSTKPIKSVIGFDWKYSFYIFSQKNIIE